MPALNLAAEETSKEFMIESQNLAAQAKAFAEGILVRTEELSNLGLDDDVERMDPQFAGDRRLLVLL
jgi:hypothetical protein